VLKEAQLKVSELQMTVRQLSTRNAELSTRLRGKGKGSQKSRKDNLSTLDQRTSRYAKHFGVMHEPFIDKTALLASRPNVDSTNSGRYQSDLSKIQGVTAELYEILPEDMHDELQSSTQFQSLVSARLKTNKFFFPQILIFS
jgi:hypothetical protein